MPEKSEIEKFFHARTEHFFDKSARWLFEDPEYVRGLVGMVDSELVELIDFSRIEQVKRSFILDNLRDQESDMVFRVPFQSGSDTDELLIYILIEHQSTVDPTMGFRVLYYMTQIWDYQRREWEAQSVPKSRWRFCPILPIVFYTGDQKWTTPLTLNAVMDIPEALARFVPQFDALLLSVKESAKSELTKTHHPIGWLLSVLRQEGETAETFSDALVEALSHISALDEASARQRRRALAYLLLLILHRRPFDEQSELTQLLEQHVLDTLDKEEAEHMAQTIVEHHFEQGKVQGIEQGRIQEKQTDILKALRLRFHTVPESIADNISLIRSLSRLDSLLEQAVTAKTLDEIDLRNVDS